MGDIKRNKPTGFSQRLSLTPEQIIARQFRARCRFRALIRLVIRNLYWLGDVEDEQLGDDVQKNILVLTKRKKKGLLLRDKSLLNKPTEHRTQEEKNHLERSIGGLKCFRKYPKNVKSKLPGVTYFAYYGPGRTIIREGHASYALYFIITGEVTVFVNKFDPVLKQFNNEIAGVTGPGGMFGEVSLLMGIPRTATIVTNTDCEFLLLKKEDFNFVLKETVQKEWDTVQSSLKRFTYFDNWDQLAIRECCIISKLIPYSPNQIILGDGYGRQDQTYFILKGKCQVIEHLHLEPYFRNGIKHYRLYNPCSDNDPFSCRAKTSDLSIEKDSASITLEATTVRDKPGDLRSTKHKQKEIKQRKSTNQLQASSSRKGYSKTHASQFSPYIETHFMQVCFLGELACFGIGENMNNRRIVATEDTQCLLIPRYWLFHRNIGNVWGNIQHCLNTRIPSTEEVFKLFLQQRKWEKHCKQLMNTLMKKQKVNGSFNVPYFIRIHEELNK